jgi:hypothetical protein
MSTQVSVQPSTQLPYWKLLLLQLSGPLIIALVGSLAAGVALSLWSSKRADRAATRDLRMTLITNMVEVASHFRASGLVVVRGEKIELDAEHHKRLCEDFIDDYKKFFAEAAVLEAKLDSFSNKDGADHWHAATDCMKLSFLLVRGVRREVMEEIRKQYMEKGEPASYSGETRHSGLTERELKDLEENKTDRGLDTIDKHGIEELMKAIMCVRDGTLTPPRGDQRAQK